MSLLKKQALLFFALSVCAFGQGVRYDVPPILNSRAVLVPNANISLCPGTATITNSTCSPASTQAFTDITLTTPCATGSPVVLPQTNVCSGVADSLGNAGFWLAPGAYIYCINGPTITGKCYNLTVPMGSTTGGGAIAKSYNAVQQADQFTVTSAVTAPVNAPLVGNLATGGTVAANNYKCETTWVGATSGETLPSPASVSTTTIGATSSLQCMPGDVIPPAGALSYNVYWQTAGAGSFFQSHTFVALTQQDSQTTTPPTTGATPPVSNTSLAVLPTVQTAVGSAGTMVIPSTMAAGSGAAGSPAASQTILDYRNSAYFSNGRFFLVNPGTFIRNIEQDTLSVGVNGFDSRSLAHTLFASDAHFTQALSVGIIVPNSSTSNQVNAVAGFAIDQRTNPVTPSVGVFGVGSAQALNARVWGANFIGTDLGSASASNSIYGGENDCFISIVSSLCRGLLIEAFWSAGIQPTTVYGIEVGQPLGSVAAPHWTYGIRFDLGATQAVTGGNAGIFFDRSATGNSQRSQGMLFESTNSGGTNPTGFLDMDPNGNLTYVSNVVGTGFQVGAVGINTPSVLFNGFTSGTVTHTAPNTITSYTETDPAAAPTVANAVKQYTTGGVASFSASPGTLTIANGTKALNTASITTATCDAGVAATANGTLSTDTVNWSFNSAPTTANKYGAFLVVYAVPSANTVTFYTCNPSATTSTPTAMTVNFNVTR